MNRSRTLLAAILLASFAVFTVGCQNTPQKAEGHLVNDYPALLENGNINVVVEIPAGTNQKWEVDKNNGRLKWDMRNGQKRVVKYLPYPGNYGMIPRSILPKDKGGDGDPLDVIVLGEAKERGLVMQARLIGVIKLLDDGEQDDKLIAVDPNGPLGHITSLRELDKKHIGASSIIKTFFVNYKGPGEMKYKGFGQKKEADKILKEALGSFQ